MAETTTHQETIAEALGAMLQDLANASIGGSR